MKTLKRFFLVIACLSLLAPLCRQAQADPVSGVYRITAKVQPGMCFDVSNFANANGTAVVLWYANRTSNQQWLVERQTDATYKIYAYSGQNSLQMLDLANNNIADGTTVATYEDNNADAQRWYFKDMGDGYYRIIPKRAGLNGTATLDVRNGESAKQGDALNVYHYIGTSNQLFRLDWAGPAKLLGNDKKGVGGRENKTGALNAAWVYTWGSDKPGNMPLNVEFVPMSWGYYGGDSTQWAKDKLAQPGVKTMLAYNEPDHTDQSNLSVDYALQGYAGLAAAGKPIGSPACADPWSAWMSDFMNKAAQRGYRVDYIAIHSYIRDPYQFLNNIEQVHNRYWDKPMWITEFAPTDWASPSGVTVEEAKNFMRIVVPELNRRWYVQRYAWYTGSQAGGNWTLSSAGLVNGDGTLSELGRLYSRM